MNGKKLTPNSSYPLCNGDAVRLSPFTAPGVSYKFCFNLKRYEPETEQQNTNKIEPHTMITSESWDVRPSDTLKDYKSNTQPTTTVVNSRLNAKIRNASELRSDDDDVITPKKQILIKRNSELEIALQTAQRQLEEYKRRNSVQSSEQVEVDKVMK